MPQTNKCVCAQFYPFAGEFLIKDQDPPHSPCVVCSPCQWGFFSAQMSPFLLLSHPGFSNGWVGMAAEYKRVSHSGAQCGQTEVRKRSLIWEVDYGVITTLNEWSHSSIVSHSNYKQTPCVCACTRQSSVVRQIPITVFGSVIISAACCGVSPLMPLPFHTHFCYFRVGLLSC